MVTPYSEGSILKLARTAKPIDIIALTKGAPVLVLTPHPDDESLGCGAAIASASRRGIRVIVACLTDGSGSHPNSPSFPVEQLAALRFQELKAAVAILSIGGAEVVSLRMPDQGATPEALSESHALEKLQTIIETRGIGTIWTTWEKDPHVDHQSAAALAFELVRDNPSMSLWRFPVWGRFTIDLPADGDTIYRFDGEPVVALKRRAVAAHASQMTDLIKDDPTGFTMDEKAQQHFLEFPEIFIGSACNDQQV